ncbi:MAG: DsrE family protein [Armatimonadetes bacterium]|nr:DsrE family protein [Armatimonadota bacterium]
MAKLLYMCTHGSEDPTRATLPFLFARGAIEAGHQAEVVLAGDAAVLARRAVTDNIQGVGVPALQELVRFCLDNGVPIHT